MTEEVKKESYSGIYHSVSDCITYKNDEIEFHFIPTYYGLAIELNILEKSDSDLLIPIDLENCNYQNDNAGYIKIFEENSDVAVIYPGISTDSCGELFINKGLTLTRQNNQTYLKFQLGDLMNDSIDFPIQSSISLDLYNEKMFFDSSFYQNKPQLNSFLSNISIFDNKNSENCGYTYLKLNLDSITPANSSLLKSLYYNFFAIECSEDVDLEAYLVPQTWCSFTINWDDKPEYTQKIGEVHIDGPGYYSLDITNFARNYIENSINYSAECSLLLKLKDSNKGLLVLASADNTSMPPYFEVNYSVEG